MFSPQIQVAVAKSFFASPFSAKRELDNRKSRGGIRGYFALGQENLNTAQGEKLARYRGDQKEGFDVGYEATSSDKDGYSGFSMAGMNVDQLMFMKCV
jgi:isopenicillin N synthase-like dioxygenase